MAAWLPGSRGKAQNPHATNIESQWTDDETAALVNVANAYPLWSLNDLAVRFSEDHYPDKYGHVRTASQCLHHLKGTLNDTRGQLDNATSGRNSTRSKFMGGVINKLYIARIMPSQDRDNDQFIDKLHSGLCKDCHSWQLRYLTDGMGVSFHDMRHPANTSIALLRQSSMSCNCCKFIYGLLGSDRVALDLPLKLSSVNYEIGLFSASDTERRQLACFSLVHLDDWRPLDGRNIDTSFWDVMTTEQSSIRRTISAVAVPDPSCAAMCEQIRSWLGQCSRHAQCANNHAPTFPDRILALDVPDCEFLRLEERPFDRVGAQYAALSYCWGRQGQYLFNESTRSTMRAGLEVSKLPRTIKNAIMIARTLGYSYLWVDALCILQGSTEDWEQQSAQMADIYGNAHLTLIASNSAGVLDGFLQPRVVSETYCGYHRYKGRKKPLYLSSPFPGFNGYPALGSRDDGGLDNESDWRSETEQNETSMPFVAHEPLTSRGWAAQERKLSIRKVYFGSKQMIWECQACLVLENGYMVRDGRRDVFKKAAPSQTDWARAVEVYSRCRLSRITDRLPAISGTASDFARKTKDQYLAGHFLHDLLLSSLVWEPTAPLSSKDKNVYLAPSWSWASQEGAVQYPHVEGRLWFFEAVAKLISHAMTAKGQNNFGEVVDGWLELQAPVLRTPVSQLPEKTVQYEDGSLRTFPDHARGRIKHTSMALSVQMSSALAAEGDHNNEKEAQTAFTLDYNDLQPATQAIFVILSKRTNATRRRELQMFQPENSFVRRSTYGGMIATPTDKIPDSGLPTFRRIGAFYEMTTTLPSEENFVAMRCV